MPLLSFRSYSKVGSQDEVLLTRSAFSLPSESTPHPTLVAWQRGASHLGANKVLVYQYLITSVGVASGIVLLGEGLGVEKIIGGAVILFGVSLARRQ